MPLSTNINVTEEYTAYNNIIYLLGRPDLTFCISDIPNDDSLTASEVNN